ncbi:class I SAM-dependent methyltransferase [Nitrosococcus wardiae]|uniref:Class I SAM-dependent methyltransferase n=1 Tax=Nitrosococcus wardiae TaxID=1814290 RepID=A0A4P7BZ78_9GAMM|nr:class I SAM-dependent methyltransferase [Nitrosococcus wardiae]QBQ54504.1 class I SAM-dependent methyltransferase [Nitrosococcus wardiae]
MFSKLFNSRAFKRLSEKSNFIQWLYAARQLRWELNAGQYPIYIDYPINPMPRYGHGNPPHKLLYELLKNNSLKYEETINKFALYREYLCSISMEQPINSFEPFWRNGWIGGIEAAALYCFPCLLDSKLYIEIGSGNSTKFVRKAIQQNNLKTKIVSVDPHPRAEIDSLCDEVLRKPLEDIDITLFNYLNSGDILMIDGSHRCFQNSDVTVFFLEILPILKPGVLVYIDDIYLPYDYPLKWRCRYYSEQYLLGTLLLADSGRYEVILPCKFISNDEYLSSHVDSFWDKIGLPKGIGCGNGFWFAVKTH